MNRQSKLLGVGVVGTSIAALCCFTPVLVVFLSIIGLSGLLGYLDYFLLPMLAFFISLTVYALYRYNRDQPKPSCCPPNKQDETKNEL